MFNNYYSVIRIIMVCGFGELHFAQFSLFFCNNSKFTRIVLYFSLRENFLIIAKTFSFVVVT
jgi:hypothetical protein